MNKNRTGEEELVAHRCRHIGVDILVLGDLRGHGLHRSCRSSRAMMSHGAMNMLAM